MKWVTAVILWSCLLTRAEGQAREVDFTGLAADSTVVEALASYWTQRDSITHVCAMGHVQTHPTHGRYVVIDSVRPGGPLDKCWRPEDVGAIGLTDGGDPTEIIAFLTEGLKQREDLYFLAVLFEPYKAHYVIRTAH